MPFVDLLLLKYKIAGLLKFYKSGDQDGFIGDFSAKTKLTTETYQLKVKTVPGDGLFEVSINYDIKKNVFSTKVSNSIILRFKNNSRNKKIN